ncbi:hypothetical protein [Frankia sp. Cas4]|uniref:hypothetical protein n=1 Tax=Frankia sp. Cas4 TaxID=3073927 RepID=UPI002AD392A9|nr:hypothetical protein [Frankia sp. Cas4]
MPPSTPPLTGSIHIAFLLLALFAEMERTYAAERAAHAQDDSLGTIATKTGIPKTSLHRYLASEETYHGYRAFRDPLTDARERGSPDNSPGVGRVAEDGPETSGDRWGDHGRAARQSSGGAACRDDDLPARIRDDLVRVEYEKYDPKPR